jgi:hypothetical protein
LNLQTSLLAVISLLKHSKTQKISWFFFFFFPLLFFLFTKRKRRTTKRTTKKKLNVILFLCDTCVLQAKTKKQHVSFFIYKKNFKVLDLLLVLNCCSFFFVFLTEKNTNLVWKKHDVTYQILFLKKKTTKKKPMTLVLKLSW